MQQPSLFDVDRHRLPPYQHKSATSKAAARAMAPHAPRQQDVVEACYRQAGSRGASREQVAERTGIKLSSVCGRTARLLELGRIRKVGEMRPPGRRTLVDLLACIEMVEC